MAFSFGSTAPAAPAAPATGGFGGTPAPAPEASATATTSGGFSFGGTATATTPTPVSAAGGFGFGGTSAPAPATGGLFGPAAATATAIPTPAPAGGGLFGSTTPAAPSAASAAAPNGGLFASATTSTPSLFGSTTTTTTTPAPAAGGFFNAAAPTAVPVTTLLSANMPYHSLPPQAQQMIDTIHTLLHVHNSTMNQVSALLPSSSSSAESAADVAAGPEPTTSSTAANKSLVEPLNCRMDKLQTDLRSLTDRWRNYSKEAQNLQQTTQELHQATLNSISEPMQALAQERNVTLTFGAPSSSTTSGTTVPVATPQTLGQKLRDGIRSIPQTQSYPNRLLYSYLSDWKRQTTRLEQSFSSLQQELSWAQTSLEKQYQRLQYQRTGGAGDDDAQVLMGQVSHAIAQQTQAMIRIATRLAQIHQSVDVLKGDYRNWRLRTGQSGLDPFEDLMAREKNLERNWELEVKRREIQAAAKLAPVPAPLAAPVPVGGSLFGSTPAPVGGGLFGSTTPAPAGGGLFGSTTPAPAGGGLFGSTPAPAGGGLFGATAPAPAGGGLFGSTTPAPVGGGLFGSTTPAPAPAGGGLFGGATPAPVGGGLFGSTAPVPAPAGGGLFGGATPAPAGGGLFGASTTASKPAGTSSGRSSSRRKSAGRRR